MTSTIDEVQESADATFPGTPPNSPMEGSAHMGSQRDRSASIADKLFQGFGMAKQWGLQKMGKTEPTQESAEFQAKIKLFQASSVEVTELTKRVKNLYAAHASIIEAESNFASAMAKCGSHSKADEKASENVQNFVPYTLKLSAHRKTFTSKFKEHLVDPLENLTTHEVKQAATLLKKLDADRLDFDARRNKLAAVEHKDKSSDKDKAAATKAVTEAKTLYENTKTKLADLCDLIESKKNTLLQQELTSFTNSQLSFFNAIGDTCKEHKNTASITSDC